MKRAVSKEIWLKNRDIDLSDYFKHKEKMNKGGTFSNWKYKDFFTYISWGDLEFLMALHGVDVSVAHEVEHYDNGHADIRTVVTDTETGHTSDVMFYPVDSGFGNASVENPDSRHITDSIQRASVKAVARATGLGHKLFEAIGGQDTHRPREWNNGSSGGSTSSRPAAAPKPAAKPAASASAGGDDWLAETSQPRTSPRPKLNRG